MHKAKDKHAKKPAKAKAQSESEQGQGPEVLTEASTAQVELENETAESATETASAAAEQTTTVEDVSELLSEIAALKADLQDTQDSKLRLAAEYDNFRKRSRQEKDELYAKSIVDVCSLWLPVLDNLERALQSLQGIEHEASKSAADGIALVYRQAEEALNKLNVKEITALGEIFDPNLHEAIAHAEDEDKAAEEIVEVFLKGYTIGDKVLRHSVVKVAN